MLHGSACRIPINVVHATRKVCHFFLPSGISLESLNLIALVDAGLINHSVDTALQARSNAFNIRMHRAPRPNALAGTPVAPTIALNTAALDQFRNVGHNDADCIKVYAEPRLVNKIDASLGSTSRSYSPETPMEGPLSHSLAFRPLTILSRDKN